MNLINIKSILTLLISIFSFYILEAKCVIKYSCGADYCYKLLDGSCDDYVFTSQVVACTDVQASPVWDNGGNPDGEAEVDIHEWACGLETRVLSVDTNGFLIYFDGTEHDTLHDLTQTIYNPTSDSLLNIGVDSDIETCNSNDPSLELDLELASEYNGIVFADDERTSNPTSLDNIETQQKLVSIYPNPTSGAFLIRLNSSASVFINSAKARFKVIDLSGRNIINAELTISANDTEISLPKDLKAGYYFYKFEGGITQEGRIQLVK